MARKNLSRECSGGDFLAFCRRGNGATIEQKKFYQDLGLAITRGVVDDKKDNSFHAINSLHTEQQNRQ